MSKLDELMALVYQYGRAEVVQVLGCNDRANEAHAALKSAIKAVVEDAERYRHLRDAHPDDDGLWVAMGRPQSPAGVACWREDKLDAAIDAARKPGSAA